MKNYQKQEQRQGPSDPLPAQCQLLLACLTGAGGRVPLPDFYQIWGQMLPESSLAGPIQELAPAQTGTPERPAFISSHTHSDNIREGPD